MQALSSAQHHGNLPTNPCLSLFPSQREYVYNKSIVVKGADGREVLNPLGEINARFTMDWATAMDAERPPSLG